jgi:hypothetical protein
VTKRVGRYVEATGYASGKPSLRGAHAFEACKDGSLIIHATTSDGDGEPICIEPHRVMAVLCACGDALARKPSTRG